MFWHMRRRRPQSSHANVAEIAERLRLLGCTEQQILRHLGPLLKPNENLKTRSALREDSIEINEQMLFDKWATRAGGPWERR